MDITGKWCWRPFPKKLKMAAAEESLSYFKLTPWYYWFGVFLGFGTMIVSFSLSSQPLEDSHPLIQPLGQFMGRTLVWGYIQNKGWLVVQIRGSSLCALPWRLASSVLRLSHTIFLVPWAVSCTTWTIPSKYCSGLCCWLQVSFTLGKDCMLTYWPGKCCTVFTLRGCGTLLYGQRPRVVVSQQRRFVSK